MRKSAIRCSICGKAAPPGALLCPPCRAALKRAGHLTVQDLPHYLAPVRRPGGKARPTSDAQRPRSGPSTPARTTGLTAARRVFAAVAALAALAVVAYLGQAHPEPDRASPPASRLAGSQPASAAAVAPASPATTSGTPAASAAAVVEPARPVAARVPPRAKQATLRAEAFVAPSAEPPAEIVAPAPEPPPPALAPRAPPPPPDRWQQMSDALARCDREGGFTGFICDQRVRLDSCDGFWGKVPQCPNPPENPH